jgi:fatty acyl-CoA reductase
MIYYGNRMFGIREFYKDKTIFITGASGFMGKVLLEKLLYSCEDIKEIFILIRPKKGKTAEERVADFVNLPCFHRIRDEKPDFFKKIVPIFGDITTERLGLNDEQYKRIIDETHIAFHMAASLKLEATLKSNIEMNLTGTKRVIDVCKQMKNLVVLVHLSTAFCNCDQKIMYEQVYDWPQNPYDLISCARWMSEESMNAMAKTMMIPHPNTYLYTKRLAEILVRDEYRNGLPVCIARPSIVTPAWREPLPGWVDSLNGPVGLTIAGSKGVVRTMLCDIKNTSEVIAVDQAISGLIGIAWQIGSRKEKSVEIPVYNITCSEKQRMTWEQVLKEGRRIGLEYPCEAGLWYPDVYLTKNYWVYMINVILFMWLPAYFIDFLMICFRQKTFLVRLQKRIFIGLGVLTFFAMNYWDFKSDNFKSIHDSLSKQEQEIFHTHTESVDAMEYMKTIIIGGRQYALKEPLSSLPKARIQIKILWTLHNVCRIIFYYFIVKFLLNVTGLNSILSNLVGGKI